MSDVRVHVDRARPTCPFCKDEVAGGHVWVCPGCEASHHAACHDEHGACASCALAETREAASLATKGDAPASDDPSGELASRRRELERLGFKIVRESPDELVAMHAHWRHDVMAMPLPHSVFVRRVAHLTLRHLREDLEALVEDPLASGCTVPVYLAGRVDPDARAFVEQGRAVTRIHVATPKPRLFPVILDGATGSGTFFTRFRLVGAALFPGLRLLARRLLFPTLVPEATRESSITTLVMTVLVALVFTATVSAIIVLSAT